MSPANSSIVVQLYFLKVVKHADEIYLSDGIEYRCCVMCNACHNRLMLVCARAGKCRKATAVSHLHVGLVYIFNIFKGRHRKTKHGTVELLLRNVGIVGFRLSLRLFPPC